MSDMNILKRQGQIVSAVLGNFEAVEKAMEDMEQSLGSADAELAVVQDTAAYAIQKVKNELTAIAQNNITQDFLKDIIGDVGRLLEVIERSETTLRPLFSIIEGITSLVVSLSDKLGALGTIIIAISLKNAVKGTGVFNSLATIFPILKTQINEATDSLGNFSRSLTVFGKTKQFKPIQLNTAEIFNTAQLEKFSAELTTLYNTGNKMSNKNLAQYFKNASVATQQAGKEILDLKRIQQQGRITQAQFDEGVKTITTDTARMTAVQTAAIRETRALNIALNMITQIGWMFLISQAIKGIDYLIERQKKFKASIDDVNSSAKELRDTLQELSDHSDMASEFVELAKGVNSLGENVSLTAEEFDRYHELVNQIAEDLPNRVAGYDNEGNAILNLKESVESLTYAYKELKRSEIEAAYYSDEGKQQRKDALKNATVTLGKLNFQTSNLDGIAGMMADVQTASGSNKEYLDFVKKISKYTQQEFIKAFENNEFTSNESYFLKLLGLTEDKINDDFKSVRNTIKAKINELSADIDNATKAVREIINQSLWVDVDYQKLSEKDQTALNIIAQSLSIEKLGELAEGGEQAIQSYVANLIDSYTDAVHNHYPEIQQAKKDLLSVDLSSLNIRDAKTAIDNYYNTLADLLDVDGLDIDTIKLIYPLDIDFDIDNLDKLYEKEETITQKIIDKWYSVTPDSEEGTAWVRDIYKELGIVTEAQHEAFAQMVDQYDTLDEAKRAYLELTDEEINALADLHDSFDYATYSEQVDTVVKNTNTLKKAIDTLTESGSLEADTIVELAKTFPAYSAQILATQGNSEQLKSVLTTAMVSQSSSLITTLEGLKGLSEEDQLAVDGLVTVLKSANSESTKYADLLKDLANKESLLDSVHKELNDDGYISISTYQKLIEAGEDYADLVTIENGKLKIEEQALKDLIVQKYKDQVATIELAKAEKIRELAVMSSTGATQEEIQKIRDEIAELETAANRSKDIVSILEGYTPTDNGSKGNSKSLYSNELQLLKDDLNDGIITYEQFLQKWQALNDKYHAMSEDDGGISDYEWGQNNRDIIAERTKAYEQEKARLKELYEAESITLEQYNAQLNTSLNHWLGGYAQLSSEYEKEVKSNTKELYEYRKKEYDDEIKDLKELYEKGEIILEQLDSKMSESANHWLGGIADLSDEFKDAVDDNYDYIKTHYFDKIDRNLDELEDEYKRTGDISLLDKREAIINDAISQADSKLSELYANGYTEDNDDVQFWLDRQEKYNDELKSILDERNDIINTNLKERRESYDEVYAKTGDNSVFKREIKDIEDAQKAKIALIEEYKKLGYTDESDTIKGLRDEIKDLGDDILDVNQEYADSIVKLAEKSAESIEKTIEKTGDTNKYNDIVAVYKKARDEIGKLIADEYAKGADANQSYIQKLQEQYDSLSDEIKSTFDSITKSITDSVDEQIENIDRKIKQTGDYSLISDKIGVYNKGKTDITKQIATLLLEGYSVNSEEVKELYNQLKSYDDDILDVYSEIADRIDTETQEQIDVIDREIKKTGDTKQYQIKINVLADSKKSLEDLRDELIKSGVDANSEIIKDLDKRIQSIDDDIAETSKDRIDAQVEVYEDVMSLETEQLEKYKKEQDDIFDAKIKALEDQKKVLEEQNDEIEKQNELQEKQKNILDAQRNVMKSVRMVYSGNGTWSVKATDESLEKLQEAEKELEDTKRKQQIEAIDKLIDGVEEQKKTFDDAIDKQTTAIEEGVKAFKDTMEKSYKVYGQLDYVLLKSILGEDAAQEYYDTFNTAYEKNVDQSNVATTTQDSLVESVKNQIKANNELTKTTEKETKAVDEFGDEMQKEFGVGNVDLTKRPFVSGEKMRQAGYDVDENGVSTVYTSTHFIWQGDEEHGKYVAVHVTPILPNGEVLSEQELEDYIYNQLEGNDDILKADSKGIVLKVDTDLNLTEEDIQSLNNGKPTKHMQNALDIIDKWDIALHEAQEQWMNLWFDEYGKPDFSNNKSIDLMGDKIYNGILGVVQKILKGTLSIGGILPVSQNALSQMNGYSNADNIQNNYNNFSPNVNTTVNITTTSGDVNDIKNALIDVVDNRIVAGLQAFYDGYNQSAMRTMFGH